FEDLPKTDYHTSESHNAWVELMAAIDYEDEDLGKNLQSWLNDLTDPRTGKGYYDLNVYRHDGIMGPVAVKGLQRKLYDTSALGKKHLYYGKADGDRGKLTVHAEIAYLNWQRQLLISGDRRASVITVFHLLAPPATLGGAVAVFPRYGTFPRGHATGGTGDHGGPP